ncbi:hypothetical protein SAY87_001751 [Trapa incisa]|uniref:Protein kinase domain-containing protein n=1 Tax=Trapa incisa TaxID=236973 RepID=A0AAN7PST4_9MYRT|nr:hypothetical protein SAY87_001751 [Trapa incisa]
MGIGCFSCLNSRKVPKLNPEKERGDQPPSPLSVSSRAPGSSSGTERLGKRTNVKSKRERPGPGAQGDSYTFTYQELATATGNFRPDCFLGEGGFGSVYKGRLERTGQVVAVKKLNTSGLQGNREFLVEVLMLRLLHHPNLVNLIGYCADRDQRLLVYEFMPLGSLEDHLHDLPPDKEPLAWSTRMKIAAGAARGLEYLHDKANPPVIYRDLKSSNILLEEGFHPKLSDFGLAKLGPVGDKSHVSTRVMGTYGYCAPEYAMTGKLTVKSDVYSFGVVLLELITGRKAIDGQLPHGEQNLVKWARPYLNDRRKLVKLADPRLQGCFPMSVFCRALGVASMCIKEEAAARPPIGEVAAALSFLASHKAYDPNKEAKAKGNERGGGRILGNELGEGSGPRLDLEGRPEKGDSPGDTTRVLNKDLQRERAVAEAKIWGENVREKRKQGGQESSDGSNG